MDSAAGPVGWRGICIGKTGHWGEEGRMTAWRMMRQAMERMDVMMMYGARDDV